MSDTSPQSKPTPQSRSGDATRLEGMKSPVAEKLGRFMERMDQELAR